METEESVQIPEENQQASEVDRLASVFFEPATTFEGIAQRPTWLVPLLLTLVLTALVMFIQPRRVSQDAMVKAQVKQAQAFGASNVPPAQLEAAIRGRMDSWWAKYGNILIVIVFGGVATAAMAGILMLAYMLAGTSVSFKRSLSALCWSAVPTTIIMSLLTILFLFLKNQDDLNPLNPYENVLSNLGFLVKAESQPVLQGLLGSIDIFSFWRIYLTGIAFSAASLGGISKKNSIVVIVILWVLYVMGKAGLTGLFS
jgi:hypothetical protein